MKLRMLLSIASIYMALVGLGLIFAHSASASAPSRPTPPR